MSILFYFLFLASFFCLVAGVIDPKIFTFLFGKKPRRSHVASVYIIFIIAAAVFLIIYNISVINQHIKLPTVDQMMVPQQLNSVTKAATDTAPPTIDVAPTKSPLSSLTPVYP